VTSGLQSRRSVAGFTLLEALVATALMGVILGAIATLTAQWLPSWNRGLARVQRNEQAAIALDRLVRDVSAAEYVSPNRLVKRAYFDGSDLGVTLVRSAVGPNTRPGLEIVRIAETTDAQGRLLVRTRAPFMPLAIGDPALDQIPFSDPVVLVRAPLRAVFAYAGQDGVWKSAWANSLGLPVEVRFLVRDTVAERTLSVSTATRVHVEGWAPEPERPQDPSSPADVQAQQVGRPR
jgi:general secretion pathway protein J